MAGRLIGLIITILVIYPSVSAFFISSSSYSEGLRTTYLLFKTPLLGILAMVLFYLLAKNRNKNNNKDNKIKGSQRTWQEAFIFFTLGVICLILSALTQTDVNRVLNEGISIQNNKVYWDTNRIGGIPFLSESDPIDNQYLFLRAPKDYLKKDIRIRPSTIGTTVLEWYGIWQDNNTNGTLDENVWIGVDNKQYDVTRQYRMAPVDRPSKMRLEIPDISGSRQSGQVAITIHKTGVSDSLGWVAQTLYLENKTSQRQENRWQVSPFQEALVWAREPNSKIYSLLFKFGYLFRWLGMLLLFLGFFGTRWVFWFIKDSPILAIGSFAYAPGILLMGYGLREIWPWMAKGVGYSLYGLLYLGFKPFLEITSPSNIIVGVPGFKVDIADTCSGIESVGLFIGMYLGLVLFNHKQLRLGKALFFIIPGLIGTYLVNLIRIYGIFIAGLLWGNEVMNIFHTYLGMALFVGFFLWFWRMIQKWIIRYSLIRSLSAEKLCTAPAVVSGLLVLALVVGHEMGVPTNQGNAADCSYYDYDLYMATNYRSACEKRAAKAKSTDTCFIEGLCTWGDVIYNNPQLPSCDTPFTTAKLIEWECIPMDTAPPGTVCNGVAMIEWSYEDEVCNQDLYGMAFYMTFLYPPPGGDCGSIPGCTTQNFQGIDGSSGCFTQNYSHTDYSRGYTCVPEFPAFAPFLFSLLSPLLRWRRKKQG